VQRRTFVSLASSVLAASAAVRVAHADTDVPQAGGDLDAALPDAKSYLTHVGPGESLGQTAEQPDVVLFTASAYETLVTPSGASRVS